MLVENSYNQITKRYILYQLKYINRKIKWGKEIENARSARGCTLLRRVIKEDLSEAES